MWPCHQSLGVRACCSLQPLIPSTASDIRRCTERPSHIHAKAGARPRMCEERIVLVGALSLAICAGGLRSRWQRRHYRPCSKQLLEPHLIGHRDSLMPHAISFSEGVLFRPGARKRTVTSISTTDGSATTAPPYRLGCKVRYTMRLLAADGRGSIEPPRRSSLRQRIRSRNRVRASEDTNPLPSARSRPITTGR